MIRNMKVFAGSIFLAISSIVSQAQAPPVGAQSTSPAGKEVEADGCLDRKAGKFELTNSFWWVVYYLRGKTAGLENHIGDELKVRGIEISPGKASAASSPQDRVPPTLQVTSFEVLTHKNPEGVRPVLGSLARWVSYDNPEYGVRLRYPATFTQGQQGYPRVHSNFAGEALTPDSPIVNVGIPRTTYPDSNYVEGAFTVSVDPKIHNEGTCKQFRTFWPEHTGSTTVNGISCSRTLDVGVAMGTAYSGYDFHTFQNSLCYEFSFNFAESNGGGMDVPCSMQWVSEDNDFELIRAVLSQVSFAKPLFKAAGGEEPKQKIVPSVISFEHGPIAPPPTPGSIPMATGVSWKTMNADYVQIRYPCTKSLYASTVQSQGYSLGKCGENADTNLPPNGSMGLLVDNFNPTPVELVLTLEPFRDGVGYPKESKSISILAPVAPGALLHENEKPSPPPAPHAQERTFTGCLKKIAGASEYWVLPQGSWQVAVRSDTVNLSAYANETVKVTAVRKDLQPYWIVTSLTTLSDSCEADK